MKLSFTTLGCPQWGLERIVTKASEYGFDGVDFRGLEGEMDIFELQPFKTGYVETRSRFEAAGLALTCFSSSITLASVERAGRNWEELERYVELCDRFGTRYIRAFGGKLEGRDRSAGLAASSGLLERAEPLLRQSGVKLIVETHDDWTRCEDVAALLEGTSPDTVGVLWDVHHPYRMFGEPPERTWNALGSRIAYTHWKDSLPQPDSPDAFTYRFMGEGDVPFQAIRSVLTAGGYDGWYTFEWEKRWHPDLAEPELAFPQFVRYMRGLEAEENERKRAT
ncbi:sugar phosphate isomerase/epimerase family protein [Paenibacillus hodogayensis]|uniref:Sugar phosphate isomerase/epimerase family protein n=1 Tax=Paenibacillus hodogayensis TaxID=279208 RepID=A0ABV5VTU2_9BACL